MKKQHTVVALVVVLQSFFVAAVVTTISNEQIHANARVLADFVAATQEGFTTTQEVERNASLLAVPCSVISPSPLCIAWCHEALADPALVSHFDYQAPINDLWVCLLSVWGVTVPRNATEALQLQSILTGACFLRDAVNAVNTKMGCRKRFVDDACNKQRCL